MKKSKYIVISLLLITIIFTQTVFATPYHDIVGTMRTNFSKALRTSGMYSFNGYCGSCVSNQLYTYGITKNRLNFNGNQAYSTFAYSYSTSGGYNVIAYPASYYTMRQVLTILDETPASSQITPLVICFRKGTASDAGQTFGHTLMVYAVKEGSVYYTDSMYPTVNDSAICQTIDDFCAHYSDKPETTRTEFVYNGAVLFYKYAPTSLKISTDKTVYAPGETIHFAFTAAGATSYTIGIDKGPDRYITENVTGSYSKTINEPGVYTAYFTAANRYGYNDSYKVTFEVK